MAALALNYVDVPAPELARGGVLAAARVVDSTDPHDMLGAQYLSDACLDINQWPLEICASIAEIGATDKDFDGAPVVIEGEPFTLYTGVECELQRLDEASTRARNRFNYGERAGVDIAMGPILDAMAVALPGATGAMELPAAISALENAFGRMYGGVPTLVIPQPLIGCGCQNQMIQPSLDGTLRTCSGAVVANTITDDETGPYSAYITGQITLLRGNLSVISVPQQPLGDGTYQPPRALAERTYVPLVECLAVKVEVTCS